METPSKQLTRSSTDKVLAGVCGGLGSYFETDSTIFRIIFVVATFFGGFGLLLYVVLALLVPSDDQDPAAHAEKVRQATEQVKAKVEAGAERLKKELEKGRHRRRGTGGLFLVILGLAFLLGNLGFFDWFDFEKWWPLFLIVFGLIIAVKD